MLKLILLLFALLLLGYFYFNFLQNKSSSEIPKKTNKIIVDVTEDYRALGYTGQKKLAADKNGNIYLAYRKKSGGQYEIFVAKLKGGENGYTISGTKESVSNIGNGAPQRVPSIDKDEQNNLYVVWYGANSSKNEGDRQIKFSKSDDLGESWNKWINISHVSGFNGENLWQEHPDILASNDGNIYVVLEGKDESNKNQQIKFSKSDDQGETWSEWVNINPASLAVSRPTILEAEGRIYVFAYGKIDSPVSQIYLTTSSSKGRSWSSWKNLSKSSLDARHVSAVTDGRNILVVWREGSEDLKTQLYYSYFDGKSWTKPNSVSKSSNYQFFPQLGLNSSYQASLVWIETDENFGFPSDDPKEGTIKLSTFNFSSKSFSNPKEIAKGAFYPVTLANLAAYLSTDDKYRLILTPLP